MPDPWPLNHNHEAARRHVNQRNERRELRARLDALMNVERAAREVDALFGGHRGRWTLERKVLGEDAATALLSLHDYLNDVEAARRNEASS